MNSLAFTSMVDTYKKVSKVDLFGDREFLGEYQKDEDMIEDMATYEDKLALWVAYYRMFPHVFVKDYLGVQLKDFQIVLLFNMLRKPNTMFIAARGLGKTFLTAILLLVVCILYPGTKVVVVAGTKSQSYQILAKISEIRNQLSTNSNLDYEIEEIRDSIDTTKANVEFFNGSYIKIAPSSDNARGFRANILVLDEFRMIDEAVYNSVLKRFLTTQRQPLYLNNPKYAHMTERNKEIFLSSSWYTFHWSYKKYTSFLKNMIRDGDASTYNLTAFPYQVSILAGLVNKEQLTEEMSEDGFDFTSFAMEMGAIWSGVIENGYYKYDKLVSCRTITHVEYPNNLKNEVGIKDFLSSVRHQGEIRLITADIALMGGQKNDNTVLSYMVAYPNKTNQFYIREVRYMETIPGGVQIDAHSTRIRELYSEFDCDYIVLDTNGIGMQVYGDLIRDLIHPETGMKMEGFGCMNDKEMQKLVPNQEAEKVIYSIKASSDINKSMYSSLQDKVLRRHIRLPIDSKQADNIFSQSKKYPDWITKDIDIFNRLKDPYIQTDKLITEMINLEIKDEEKLKLKEQSGERKDRFSSVAMGNFFVSTLESNLFTIKDFNWKDYCASSKSSAYRNA